MDRVEALSTLGISESEITNELIRTRYERLVRRYPARDFPEMALKVHKAYQMLQQSDADLYIRYIKDDSVDIADIRNALPQAPIGAQADLEKLLRDTIEAWCVKNGEDMKSFDLSDMIIDMNDFFEKMLKEI